MSSTTPTSERDEVVVYAATAAFRRNLRVLMALRDLKIPALADKVGVSRLWVARRANGEVTPDLADLARLASALDSSVSDLVSLDEPTSAYYPGSAS